MANWASQSDIDLTGRRSLSAIVREDLASIHLDRSMVLRETEGGLPYDIDAEGDAVSKGVAIGDVTGDGHNDLVFSVRGAGRRGASDHARQRPGALGD